MKKSRQRIGLCTGGGDCPGLNSVIRAVVRHAVTSHQMTVLGIRDGLSGLMEAGVKPLTLADVDGIQAVGGTVLGANNKGSPFHDQVKGAKMLAGIKAAWRSFKLDGLICVGGDGTQAIAKELVKAGLNIVGIPKTIDNDLPGTDLTVGYSTAVDIAADAALRLKSSAEAHNRIMILEVMGRDAGHIALATGLASGADAVLIPEIPYSINAVVAQIKQLQKRTGRDAFLIVAAEGAHAAGGAPSFQAAASGAKLLGGVGALVASDLHEATGIDTRVAVLGHIQRGGTPNAADRILATLLGARAVDMAAAGTFGKIVVVKDGKLADFTYRSLKDGRRLLDPDGMMVKAAEATGITLGR